MARYFFNVDGEIPDSDGLDFRDLNDVRREAVRAAGEMLREYDGALLATWMMRVSDASGTPVFDLRVEATEFRSA